jgi:quercetin dioxygenase-like cupin family protein
MSTSINTSIEPADAPATEADCRSVHTLSSLVELIANLKTKPTFADLQDWLASVEVSQAEIEPYLKFRDRTYVRTRVIINEHVEMLVLCWRAGHYTSIHDHNGSYSSIRVLSGEMNETLYDYDGERGLCQTGTRDWTPGHVATADIPDIHRIGNREDSAHDLITLHCYSPPFETINTYKPGSREIGELRPEEPREVMQEHLTRRNI